MALLAPLPGRLLERRSNVAPRGMTVLDRTRLIGQLQFDSCSIREKLGPIATEK